MQLTCPQCHQALTAEHINIQQMAAACPACANVFRFTLDKPKFKRRKAHQPRHLELREAEDLHIAYRSNFRLDEDANFIGSATVSALFTFAALLMTGVYLAGEVMLTLPFILWLVALPTYYWLGLIVFNKTHIQMDDVSIRVSRQPLPHIGQAREIALFDVISISAEETKISRENEYDTPRYHVWANMADGSRRIVVTDVIEDYAFFIAQKLEGCLQQDTTRLELAEDDEPGFIADAAERRENQQHGG